MWSSIVTGLATQREAADRYGVDRSVEHAWDTFQCVKTVLHPDKKKGAADLASAVRTGTHEVTLMKDEMRA